MSKDYNGWWSLEESPDSNKWTVTIRGNSDTEVDSFTLDHVAGLIKEGYTQGTL